MELLQFMMEKKIMNNIVEIFNVSKHYMAFENITKAVDNVSICIRKEEFVSIIGKSGSGKSTLMNLISGLDTVTSGKIVINGLDITGMKEPKITEFRRRNIGFIFQAFNLVSTLTVWENIILTIGLDRGRIDDTYINSILSDLDIADKINSYPNMLSGGQQQRVAIARALASKPALILADEPTGNLDSQTSDDVMRLLITSIKKYQQTILLITHDNDIANMADRKIIMCDGKIIEE